MNLKFKRYNILCTNQTFKDFIQASIILSELLFKHCSCYSDIRGVTASPLTEISSRDLEVAALTETVNNCTTPHYSKTIWMVRTEEVLAFPCCFFFKVDAPLYLEEHDCFMPRDTILLIKDLDRVLGVRQVSLERCHFQQHDIHRCLQTFLQL
jgi:hypothetical protein